MFKCSGSNEIESVDLKIGIDTNVARNSRCIKSLNVYVLVRCNMDVLENLALKNKEKHASDYYG